MGVRVFRLWKSLEPKHRRTILARIQKLGIKPVEVNADDNELFRKLNMSRSYLSHVKFQRGVLYFTKDADVQDLVHDCGHAMALTKAARMKFCHPEGDFEGCTNKTGEAEESESMVVQWVLSRDIGNYSVAKTLIDFGYGFGSDNNHDGYAWEKRLSEGRFNKNERPVVRKLKKAGLL